MIVGKKVILEEIAEESLEKMRHWRNDPELRQYFREWKDITKDKQQCWYKDRGNNSNEKHIYFQIMSRDDNKKSAAVQVDSRYLIGCCSLSYIDWRLRSAEFGIFINKSERGTGKGKEALELMCDFGFKEANLHKIWGEVWIPNESIHMYRKIGFKDEGTRRDAYFHNGKYGDSILISILEQEWYKKYGSSPIWENK